MRIVLAFILLAMPAMAGRDFEVASSQLGVCSISPISPPVTLFAWVKPSDSTSAHSVISVGTTTNAFKQVRLLLEGNVAGDPYSIGVVSSSGTPTTTQVGTYTASIWFSVCGVFSASNSRVLYTNGLPAVTNTTSVATDGLNQVVLGARKYTTYGVFLTGAVAEPAVWNVALTDAEILSLSLGASPMLIRPASLVFYAPLTGRETSTEWNLVGSAVSLTNSPAASSTHPSIYRP